MATEDESSRTWVFPIIAYQFSKPKNKALLSISLSEQVTPVSEEDDTARTLIFPSLVVVGKVLTITHTCLVRESNDCFDVSHVVETTAPPGGSNIGKILALKIGFFCLYLVPICYLLKQHASHKNMY